MSYFAIRSLVAVSLLGTALFMSLNASSTGSAGSSIPGSTNAVITTASAVSSVSPVETGSPYRTEVFQVSGRAFIQSSTSGGNITVEGVNGKEVRVEMYVRQRGKNLSASDTDLSDYEIDLYQDGNSITATARRTSSSGGWLGNWSNMGNSPSISFVIYAPMMSNTDLNTSGGNVSISSLNGDQKMRTSGGNLSLTNIYGKSEGRTSGGNIHVKDYDGDLNIQTSGGNLSIANYSGELTARTSGGRINLDKISGKISARTSGGSISGNILDAVEEIDLQTSGGNIDVMLPRETGMKLNVRGSRVSSSLDGLKGTVESGRISGSIGNEAVDVNIRTSGGSVKLSHN